MQFVKYAPGLVLLFLLTTRLWQFSLIPAALTHDEIVYAAQAKSFSVQGKTTNQQYSWWSIQPAHPMYAEFPALLMALFFKLFSNPLVATRSVSLIMGIGLPFVLAWFSYGLWRNRKLSLIVLCVSAVNPLVWQMSRLAYDAVYSTFFYLLGGAILLNVSARKKWWSVIFLVIGFFCYQGYKLLFLPWVLFLLLVQRKPTVKIGLISLVVFLGYVLILLPNQQVENRWQQTIFADINYQAATTNDNRRLTLNNPITPLISNKAMAVSQYLVKRFMGAFSIDMLFLSGEPAQSAFSVWGHGWFYLFDLVLIIFGLAYLLTAKEGKKISYYLLGFMLFSVLPSTVNSGESWYLLRTFMPNVLLLLIVSWGIYFFPNKWYFRLGIGVIYLFSTVYFGYYFYFRYPILGSNISYLAEKTTINYISRITESYPDMGIVVNTIDPPVMFWNYLVYANQLTAENAEAVAHAENNQIYQLGKVTFTNSCPDLTNESVVVISEHWRLPCEHSQSLKASASSKDYEAVVGKQKGYALTIPSVVDNGAFFRVYNDPICDRKALSNFIDINNAADFDQNRQTNEDFCTKWFSNVEL